jgi:hypothetical protein
MRLRYSLGRKAAGRQWLHGVDGSLSTDPRARHGQPTTQHWSLVTCNWPPASCRSWLTVISD